MIGFKRFKNVDILKAFNVGYKDAPYIVFKVSDEKTPRFALIKTPWTESYTTVDEECNMIEHKPMGKNKRFIAEMMDEFISALKEGLPVNLVIVIVKGDRVVEFVNRAEFV